MVCFSFAWFEIYDSRFDISHVETRMPEFWYNPTRATRASRYPCGNSNFKQSGEFPLCSQRNVYNCYAWISVTGLLLRCWLDGMLGTWNVLWPISAKLQIISMRGKSNFLMICHMQRLSHAKKSLANVITVNFLTHFSFVADSVFYYTTAKSAITIRLIKTRLKEKLRELRERDGFIYIHNTCPSRNICDTRAIPSRPVLWNETSFCERNLSYYVAFHIYDISRRLNCCPRYNNFFPLFFQKNLTLLLTVACRFIVFLRHNEKYLPSKICSRRRTETKFSL